MKNNRRVKLSQLKKVVFPLSITFVASVPFLLLALFSYVHVFSGEKTEAIQLIGLVAQGSAALTAIAFAFLIYVSQAIIGKYVSGITEYLFKSTHFLLPMIFYAVSTVTIVVFLWIYPLLSVNMLLDVSIALLLCQVAVLPLLFFAQSKFLDPKTIVDTLLTRHFIIKGSQKTIDIGNTVFSVIYNLAENKEYDAAYHGLNSVTNMLKENYALCGWAIPNYERIALECYEFNADFGPVVIGQLNELLHQKPKGNVLLCSTYSWISDSAFRIVKSLWTKPHSDRTLTSASLLFIQAYVAKTEINYDVFAGDELMHLQETLILLNEVSELHSYPYQSSLALEMACKKLVGINKFEMLERLLVEILKVVSPADYLARGMYVQIILLDIPLTQKEFGQRLIKILRAKFTSLPIELVKTAEKGCTRIQTTDKKILIETDSEEVAEKVSWLTSIL